MRYIILAESKIGIKRFQVVKESELRGLIFISDDRPEKPNKMVYSIWTLDVTGNWKDGTRGFTARDFITLNSDLATPDEEIQKDLVELAGHSWNDVVVYSWEPWN